jgi:hypothetical protein
MFTAGGYGVGDGAPNNNQISGIAGMLFTVSFKKYQADPF